jgi:catechol 2,3-dioxygenase-like lactoylglutathione lyase family enzyme
MEPRLSLVTLGVDDLDRAVAFYRDIVGWRPISTAPGIAFFDLGGTVLALWPHAELTVELGQERGPGDYYGVALAQNLRSRDEVDAVFAELRARGATIAKEPAATDWGGYSGYFTDPDGHRWELAHNPGWPLDDDGRVLLQSD